MIDRQLRSIPWANEFGLHLAMESYALTYLASYNLANVTARTLTSFQRAFGNVLLFPFQRAGTTPAFLVAVFRDDDDQVTRITIAIEGSSTISQIIQYGGSGWQTPTGCTGRVIQSANVWATAIKAALAANVNTAAWLALRGPKLIVTGFSLGGAVAEVLSALLLKDRPHRPTRLYTFGCPRVGTAAWQSANQTPDVRMNYYCNLDAVHKIPLTQQGHVANVFQDIWTPIIGFVAEQSPQTRFDLSGRGMATGGGDFYQPLIYRHSLIGLTPDNVWYSHQKDAYRMMFTNIANGEHDALPFRFIYLEFPDDNTWGNFYTPGQTNWSLLKNLAGENPPDKVVDLYEADTPGGGTGGGDDADDVGGGGGGDADQVERPIVRVNPNVRTRRQR